MSSPALLRYQVAAVVGLSFFSSAFNAFHIHLYLFRVGNDRQHQLLQVSIHYLIL
jgi:hypothetical protein